MQTDRSENTVYSGNTELKIRFLVIDMVLSTIALILKLLQLKEILPVIEIKQIESSFNIGFLIILIIIWLIASYIIGRQRAKEDKDETSIGQVINKKAKLERERNKLSENERKHIFLIESLQKVFDFVQLSLVILTAVTLGWTLTITVLLIGFVITMILNILSFFIKIREFFDITYTISTVLILSMIVYMI